MNRKYIWIWLLVAFVSTACGNAAGDEATEGRPSADGSEGPAAPDRSDGGINNVVDLRALQEEWDPDTEPYPCDGSTEVGCADFPAPKGTTFRGSGYDLTYEGANVYRFKADDGDTLNTEEVRVLLFASIRNTGSEPIEYYRYGFGRDVQIEIERHFENDGKLVDDCLVDTMEWTGELGPGEELVLMYCAGSQHPDFFDYSTLSARMWGINCLSCPLSLDLAGQSVESDILDRVSSDHHRWPEFRDELKLWMETPQASEGLSSTG